MFACVCVWRFAVYVIVQEHEQLHQAQKEPQTAEAAAAPTAAAALASAVFGKLQGDQRPAL